MNGAYGQPTHFDGGDHHQHSNGNTHSTPPQQLINPNQQRTLYVGNFGPQTTENQLTTCFRPYGKIISLKLINESVSDPYCFVEYEKHEEANIAMSAMNKRKWVDKELRVNWATSLSNIQQTGTTKTDLAKHSHIFVGDLSPEIDTNLLISAFSPFGDISDCRVVRDPHSHKSRCYGFVSFVHRQHAENAIAKMNGQVLGTRAIRTNWASRKPPAARAEIGHVSQQNGRSMTLEEVYQQSGATNFTVYCGGLFNGLTEDLIQRVFRPFGTIQDIRVFKDKGYAFIRFANKEAAANAIFTLNNQDVGGQIIKCSWGKGDQETGAPTNAVSMLNQHPTHAHLAQNLNAAASALATNYLYNPYGQIGSTFWYPPPTMQMPQGLPHGMQYSVPYPGQFYPSSSPGAPPNGFMMGAQMAAMQQQQPPTTPNGVPQSSQGPPNQSHQSQATVTPQTHHHHQQHPSTANVQTHHPQAPQPNGSHFGAYQPPPQVMAFTPMQ